MCGIFVGNGGAVVVYLCPTSERWMRLWMFVRLCMRRWGNDVVIRSKYVTPILETGPLLSGQERDAPRGVP